MSMRWLAIIAVTGLITAPPAVAADAPHLPEPLSQVLKPAAVFDGIDGKVHAGWQVLVTGDRIVSVGPALSTPANAKSVDPVKVAHAMEGLKVKSFSGDIEMRKSDHQLQQPLYMSVWQKADAKYPYSPEKTGMTLAPVKEIPAYVSSTPTSCEMKRPS